MILMAIDSNSPIGYAVTILILGVVIWWSLLKNNAYTNPVRRDQYSLDLISNLDYRICPECKSENVKFDLTMEPIILKYKDCDHEWFYVPR